MIDFIVYSNSIRNHAVIQEYNTLAYIYNSLNNKLGTGMCPTPLSALGQLKLDLATPSSMDSACGRLPKLVSMVVWTS